MRSSRLALLVACILGSGIARAELVDRIVAIVDREVITLSEAEEARALAMLDSERAPELVDTVERLIERRLIEREVERFGVEPVAAELVEEAEARLRSAFGSEEALQDALARRGLHQGSLRALLRRQLTVNDYLEKRFRALTYVTDEEVERFAGEELVPGLPPGAELDLEEHAPAVRRILEERKFNERVEQWVDELKSRARIRRYVW